jgi:hypothetical protein
MQITTEHEVPDGLYIVRHGMVDVYHKVSLPKRQMDKDRCLPDPALKAALSWCDFCP